MNKIAKADILASIKGPSGGFFINHKTLDTPLLILFHLTDGTESFEGCVLRLKKCGEENPCPMHHRMEANKKNILGMLPQTTIGDLLKKDKHDFIKSISCR
jgi:DNA-binding IscR family transcriptional regulator